MDVSVPVIMAITTKDIINVVLVNINVLGILMFNLLSTTYIELTVTLNNFP